MDGRTDRPSYRDARTHVKTGGPLADHSFDRGFFISLKPADHQRTIEWISDTETSGPLANHFHLSCLMCINKIGGQLSDHPFHRGVLNSLKPADHQLSCLMCINETDRPLANHQFTKSFFSFLWNQRTISRPLSKSAVLIRDLRFHNLTIGPFPARFNAISRGSRSGSGFFSYAKSIYSSTRL